MEILLRFPLENLLETLKMSHHNYFQLHFSLAASQN
jgi:hypothetical protein